MKYFVCLIMFIGSAKAAEFCVTGGGELLAAINTANNNNQADHIKVSEGSYTTPPGGYIFETTQNDDLEISGGWTSFMGNDCGQQLAGSPFDTTIDANQSGRVMRIRTGPHANITLSGMNFINGFLTGPGNNTGSLLIDLGYSVPEVSPTGKVVIERMSFLNNNAFGSGAVYVNNANTIVFRNNLLAANNSESGSSVIGLLAEDDMNGVYVINNTILW